VLRPGGPSTVASAQPVSAAAAPRRSRVGLVVGVVAGVVVAAVIGIAIAMAGTVAQPPAVETAKPGGGNAAVPQAVPAPLVSTGVASADGTVTFEVSHSDAEDGDKYRWTLSDGSGDPQIATGETIVVDGASPGVKTCIDVQVQRGSKVSEPKTGCTP